MQDCELYVHRPIAPLSYEIVKIQFTKMDKPKEPNKPNELDPVVSQNPTYDTKNLNPTEVIKKEDDVSLDYTKLCQDPLLKITNLLITLRVIKCSINQVTFGMKREKISTEELIFDFDFRFYVPTNPGDVVGGGLYVFKTANTDSTPYVHTLNQIMAFTGKYSSWFLVTYKNRVGPPSQVKIKLGQNTPYIEFDLFFGPFDKSKYSSG